MDQEKLIKKLNQTLKDVAACDDEQLYMQGEKIREVFFTIMQQDFTIEEINVIFQDVHISDEKLALIDTYDGKKR